MISPFTEEKKCCKNVIFLLLIDSLFVTKRLRCKQPKNRGKAYKIYVLSNYRTYNL